MLRIVGSSSTISTTVWLARNATKCSGLSVLDAVLRNPPIPK
jgi:hypothetical protein